MSNIMIVTDAGLLKTGIPDRLLSILRQSDGIKECHIYSEIQADPNESSVVAALKFANKQSINGIIGLGGGSSMDVAKVIALLKCSKESVADVYGVNLSKGPRLPLLQIPTTAGTGSEVTPISILTTDADEKKGIVSDFMYPDMAILDPELTLMLPPHVTAMTGVDACVHAIEAFTSKIKKNPISDAFAIHALKLMLPALRKVVSHGSDLEARTDMLQGSLLAGMAFANAPVGAVHALAYPLGGRFHVPHGLSNALMLEPGDMLCWICLRIL